MKAGFIRMAVLIAFVCAAALAPACTGGKSEQEKAMENINELTKKSNQMMDKAMETANKQMELANKQMEKAQADAAKAQAEAAKKK